MACGSSPPPAVSIRGLSKAFRIRTKQRRFSLAGGGIGSNRGRTLWALDDLTLEIGQGETFGIVGMNGSGKSTLLKLIAGIASPTRGEVYVEGQIGSLIELGAGFHPELSGYENVFLNGTILGIPRAEIERRLADIVAFSGLEEFMEMPVKHYSSGMQMRLGFAVAIQLDPQVLLLDETLSVGDAEFQSRALKAIRGLHDAGATTLMVSHDIFSIREYCERAMWLHQGKARMIGPPAEVVDAYFDYLTGLSGQESRRLLALNGNKLFSEPVAGDSPLSITSLRVLDDSGRGIDRCENPDRVTLEIRYRTTRPLAEARMAVALVCRDSKLLAMETDSDRSGAPVRNLGREGRLLYSFEARHFCSEPFVFRVAAYAPGEGGDLWARDTVAFDLVGHAQPTPESFHYLIAPCDRYEQGMGGL